jgi:hypothetical protein
MKEEKREKEVRPQREPEKRPCQEHSRLSTRTLGHLTSKKKRRLNPGVRKPEFHRGITGV